MAIYHIILLMSKKKKAELRQISDDDFTKVVELYWKWKELNSEFKELYSRGVNLHEAITEMSCCYANNYLLSLGGGSEDAVNPETKELIQVKGSSNWDEDLSSFGPESEFDQLHFARLNDDEDKLYLYEIPVDELSNVKVNKNNTFEEFQNSGKRPRFSIIKKYIVPDEIEPYAYVDFTEKEVVYLEEESTNE